MIQVGDKVSHNTFPPIVGTVMGAQPILNSEPKISVMKSDGSLFWDYLSTWNLLEEKKCEPEVEAIDTYTVPFGEERDVIDVEFREVD